jgi:hypothetical protein
MSFQVNLLSSLSNHERICDQRGTNVWITEAGYLSGDFLTISEKDCIVRWYSSHGTSIFRSFSFKEPPLDSVFCLLSPFSVDSSASTYNMKKEDQKRLNLGVAVLVSAYELQIFYSTGERYETMLPAASKYLLACPLGIVLQASIVNVTESDSILPSDSAHSRFLRSIDENESFHDTGDDDIAIELNNAANASKDTNVILYLSSPNSSVDFITSSYRLVFEFFPFPSSLFFSFV